MVKVESGTTLRMLAGRFMKRNRRRNHIVILAVILTTVLFTSLFEGAVSMALSKLEADKKKYISYNHAILQDLTGDEAEKTAEGLEKCGFVKRYGHGSIVGLVSDPRFSYSVEVRDGDADLAAGFGSVPTVGRLPEAVDEIAVSTVVLDTLGLPREIGTRITLPIWRDDGEGETKTETFRLCGYWDGDKTMQAQFAWVSRTYASQYPQLTAEAREQGRQMGCQTYVIWFDSIWNLSQKAEELGKLLGTDQFGQRGVQVNPAYEMLLGGGSLSLFSMAALLGMILLAGYLIIYNIFSLSIQTDLRAYGLLKNVGTTGKQLKKIVRMQAFYLSAAGIPIGLFLGYLAGIWLAPTLTASLDGTLAGKQSATITSGHPLIFAAAALFALLTVYLSSLRACRMVARLSPVEAIRLSESGQEEPASRRKRRRSRSVSWWSMALQNQFRTWKRSLIVMLSIAISLVTLNCIVILVRGYDFTQYKEIYLEGDFQLDKLTSSAVYADFEGITPDIMQQLEANPYSRSTGYVYYSREQHEMEPHLRADWEQIADRYLETWGTDWKAIWEQTAETNQIPLEVHGISRTAFEKLDWVSQPCTWEAFQTGAYILVERPQYMEMDTSFYEEGEDFVMDWSRAIESRTLFGGLCVGKLPAAVHMDWGRAIESRTYQVAGEVMKPYSLGYCYADMISLVVFVPEDEFTACTGITSAMQALIDAIPGQEEELQQYLEDTVLKEDTTLNLVSVLDLKRSFMNYINKFYYIGACLAVVLAVIGILNFYNTSAASILSRKRELALLEAVGMTRKQVFWMLTGEGMFSLMGALGLALWLTWSYAGTILTHTLGNAFFFQAKITVVPCILLLPVLFLMACLIPKYQYLHGIRESLTERLKQE